MGFKIVSRYQRIKWYTKWCTYILDNHKVNVENNRKITTENISISVSQLQIKQRN